MGTNTSVDGRMTNNTGKAPIPLPVGKSMLVNGKTVCQMDWVSKHMLMAE
jgi:hypothetical protein